MAVSLPSSVADPINWMAGPANGGAPIVNSQTGIFNLGNSGTPQLKDDSAVKPSITASSTTAPSTGFGTASPDYSAFNSLYDASIGNLQNQYGALPAYQNEAVDSINRQYNPQANTLNTQHASGQANLDLAQNQLDTNKAQGLRNLGNSLRGALNGYQNQIGVMGAGNSSAAPLIGYALSQQGNRQMSDMNTNYAQQETGIHQQQNDLEANFKNQMDTLDAWKQSNLNDIAARYAQTQQQLQQQIMGAQGDKARYLATYGQTALANQAIQQMQALEAQYKDQIGQLNTHFGQVNAPSADISQYTGQRTINAVSPQQLTPLSFQSNNVTPDNTSVNASLVKRPDQTPNTPNFGF